MRHPRLVNVLLLAGLAGSATAQIVPSPLIATVVNFDDIVGAPTQIGQPIPVLDPDRYVSEGVRFTGFGNSGGIILDYSQGGGGPPTPAVSLPNALTFIGIAVTAEGGLAQSPETLSFYPPVTSLQFDVTTINITCVPPEILRIEGFAPGGASLGSMDVTLPPVPDQDSGIPQGITISAAFPSPGAERVVVTAVQVCSLGPQLHLEAWSMDNVAFAPVGTGVRSKCAQSALDAAGKKAKAVAACYAKALQNGVLVDQGCLDKATATFNTGFAKALGKGDCLTTDTDGPTVETVEAAVDTLATDAVNLVAGQSPGPDVCFGKKLTAIGKKAQRIVKCYSKAAQTGAAVDEACGEKAANSFNASLKKCGTPTQLGPVEALIDQFAALLSRSLTVPTTTTTTTTTSTTTTTTAPPLGPHLSFTTTIGATDCRLPIDPMAQPVSGEIDSDTVGTKISDLGLGCLYIGGGAAVIPPSQIPEDATSILDSPDGTTLVASFGTGPRDCSRGPASTSHCVNDPTVACTSDAGCGGFPGSCAPDANCFFGPPVEVNGFPPTCIVNTFAQDASGTVDTATGESSVSITLGSRVFLTIGQPSTCPHCDGGACTWGPNAGQPCTTTNSQLTTLDCPPDAGSFTATLPVDLTPLTTGATTVTAADGLFCPDQAHAGAFSDPTVQAITQTGSPGGNLTDGLPHPSVLVSNFCIPPTGNGAVDAIADLPGPGSLSLPGNAQFVASPSGAFLSN